MITGRPVRNRRGTKSFSRKDSTSALPTTSKVKQQHSLSARNIMADRRPEDPEMSRAKRPRTDDPANNPYLAHMYENQDEGSNGYSNGYDSYKKSNGNGASARTSLSDFKRHETTAVQAHTAEDGPANPFNNNPLSKQYFNILKTRRDLPVHKQR